ncbi:tol-pal system protein YbgF [Hasllibacter halocynthiae]|uniref:Cell division coordinator CpoB n=1 Tax=Hasllibacter halocynthiae TaxID=595589 RepID=A0A2T0X9N8_9RHOB|nr:tol-pal system protein YbgF [Hasllibacter halocynthiae]PRY95637.1 tol-pal system protein YbgF [Hasllibacter halocynthiae]
MRALLCVLALLAGPALSQDREATLADIRQQLVLLNSDVQGLRRELSTTGGQSLNLPSSALERIDAIESELQRLTSATEALTGRVDRVVTDGTRRIGDLEFRLVELEGGDVSQLAETSTLGGGELPEGGAQATPVTGGAQLALGEQADFDAAQAAFDGGDYAQAATLFATFAESYPGGPLTGTAKFREGEALERAGDLPGAARAYLAAFSGDPEGAAAGDALHRLGLALRDLGQTEPACITLADVQSRFPGSGAAAQSADAARAMGCS